MTAFRWARSRSRMLLRGGAGASPDGSPFSDAAATGASGMIADVCSRPYCDAVSRAAGAATDRGATAGISPDDE